MEKDVFIEFKNLPDTSTPLNAENLNQMQSSILELLKGTVLYENEQGTTDTLTLNDNRSNYKRLVFYGKNTGEASAPVNGTKLGEFLSSTNEVTLNIFRQRNPNLYMYLSDWEFNGNTLNCYANFRSYFNSTSYVGRDTASSVAITKIVGYKY